MYQPEMERIPCVIMRGGTSKAVFLLDNDLPRDQTKKDKIILSIFGSPDSRQIDGLGGADPLTSKLAIIAISSRDDADIDYTFGQVDIHTAFVDYSSNCGNISSAVGPFAITQGLVKITEPITTVRIFNTNTEKVFESDVAIVNGKPAVIGDYNVDGVPGTGARISLNFAGTVGSKTGKLLPTGNAKDHIDVEGFGALAVSLVDAGSPMVFVLAEDLGLKGIESPKEIDSNPEMLELLEKIRCIAAEKMGIASRAEAREKVRAVPMVAFVSPPQPYKSHITGEEVKADDIDFVARDMFMQIMHKTYSVTATVCTGCAAIIPGTIVNDVMRKNRQNHIVRIGHPGGVIDADMNAEETPQGIKITRAAIGRTARRIMEGYVYVPRNIFD